MPLSLSWSTTNLRRTLRTQLRPPLTYWGSAAEPSPPGPGERASASVSCKSREIWRRPPGTHAPSRPRELLGAPGLGAGGRAVAMRCRETPINEACLDSAAGGRTGVVCLVVRVQKSALSRGPRRRALSPLGRTRGAWGLRPPRPGRAPVMFPVARPSKKRPDARGSGVRVVLSVLAPQGNGGFVDLTDKGGAGHIPHPRTARSEP